VKALIRRFLQVLVSGGGGAPEFIAGGLYLLGEVGAVVLLFLFQNPSLVFVASLDCFSCLMLSLSSLLFLDLNIFESPVYSVLSDVDVFFFLYTALQQCTRPAEHDQRPAKTCFINTRRQFLRPKKTRTPIRSCLCSPALGASKYHPIVYFRHQKAYPLHFNRRHSSRTTTPQYLCTPVNSSQASHSQRRQTLHRTRSRISSRDSCTRTLKSPRCRLRVSTAMRTRSR
jgi:hypothetical protein